MSTKKGTTLRLNMPQWQGGNRHDYYFGSELLAWLAPPANGPVETIPVPEPKPGETLEKAPADAFADVPRGRMAPDQVVRLLQDAAAACDVVSLAIAEYMPWEAITTRDMLRKLPLLAG